MNLQHLSSLRKALETSRTTVVVGIGAELRGDDVAGVLVARAVASSGRADLIGIEGCAAPENFTGEIISHSPDLVVFVDAAEFGEPAGSIKIIEESEIRGFSFSTHTLPLHVILNYLTASLPDCRFVVVGIQPEDTQIMAPPSAKVLDGVEKLSRLLNGAGPAAAVAPS